MFLAFILELENVDKIVLRCLWLLTHVTDNLHDRFSKIFHEIHGRFFFKIMEYMLYLILLLWYSIKISVEDLQKYVMKIYGIFESNVYIHDRFLKMFLFVIMLLIQSSFHKRFEKTCHENWQYILEAMCVFMVNLLYIMINLS